MNKTNEILFEIAKERYLFEMEHKDQINNYLSLPLGVLALLGGLFINSGNFIKDIGYNNISLLYYIILLIYCAGWITSIIFLALCFLKKYKYILTPDGWVDLKNDLVNYYNKQDIEYTDEMIEDDIKSNLLKQYIDSSYINSWSNYTKNALLTKAKIFILITACIGLPLIGVENYYKIKSKTEPFEVKIVQMEKTKMDKSEKTENTAKPQTTNEQTEQPIKPQQTQPAIPKPEARPGFTLTEGLKPQPKPEARPGRIVIATKKVQEKNDKE